MQELEQRAAWDGKIFVDGGFRTPDGGGTLTVLDKAAQTPLGTVGVASAADLDAAVAAAAAAQPDWAATPYDVRAGILRAAAAALQARADEIATLIVRETGSIRGKAEYEVGGAANELFEAAGLTSRATATTIPSHNPTRVSVAQRIPRGVVGVLTPWNFPLILGMRVVAPALALGNAVVLKPSPETPITGGIVLAEMFAAAGLPPGCSRSSRATSRSGRRSSPTRASRWSTSPARRGPAARSPRSPAASSSTARSSWAATTRSSCSTTPTWSTPR